MPSSAYLPLLSLSSSRFNKQTIIKEYVCRCMLLYTEQCHFQDAPEADANVTTLHDLQCVLLPFYCSSISMYQVCVVW